MRCFFLAVDRGHEPTVGRHIVLLSHVIPRTHRLLTLVEVEFAVTNCEVSVERQILLDDSAFGKHAGDTAPCSELLVVLVSILNIEFIACIVHYREIERMLFSSRHEPLGHYLIAVLKFHD